MHPGSQIEYNLNNFVRWFWSIFTITSVFPYLHIFNLRMVTHFHIVLHSEKVFEHEANSVIVHCYDVMLYMLRRYLLGLRKKILQNCKRVMTTYFMHYLAPSLSNDIDTWHKQPLLLDRLNLALNIHRLRRSLCRSQPNSAKPIQYSGSYPSHYLWVFY